MTLEAVKRALEQTFVPERIYVVDNGSGDNSIELLDSALANFGNHVKFLQNPHNGGFGSGCNPAIRQALNDGMDHIWLLNNDAIPALDCLEHLIETMITVKSPPIGIVGSLLVDPTGETIAHFGSWMNPITQTCSALAPGIEPADHHYGWMTAASMLVSAVTLDEIGLFDQEFFMYWEDADLNMRVRQAGFLIVGASSAIVEHHAGTSSSAIPVQRYLWHFASQDRFLKKHHRSPNLARITLRFKYITKALLDRDRRRFFALIKILIH